MQICNNMTNSVQTVVEFHGDPGEIQLANLDDLLIPY